MKKINKIKKTYTEIKEISISFVQPVMLPIIPTIKCYQKDEDYQFILSNGGMYESHIKSFIKTIKEVRSMLNSGYYNLDEKIHKASIEEISKILSEIENKRLNNQLKENLEIRDLKSRMN